MWESYLASLQNVGGSPQVPVCVWKKESTRGLPPAVNLDIHHMSNTTSMLLRWKNQQSNTKTKSLYIYNKGIIVINVYVYSNVCYRK
jgi:hypothetical protein